MWASLFLRCESAMLIGTCNVQELAALDHSIPAFGGFQSTINPSCVPHIISYFRNFSYFIASKVVMPLTRHVLLLPFHLKLCPDWNMWTKKRKKRKTEEIEMSCSMNLSGSFSRKKRPYMNPIKYKVVLQNFRLDTAQDKCGNSRHKEKKTCGKKTWDKTTCFFPSEFIWVAPHSIT